MPRKLKAALLLLLFFCGTAAAETPTDIPRLASIYKADQEARRVQPIDWSKVRPQDEVHRKEVLSLLRSGRLRTSNDFYHAAMVFQHGESPADFTLAFSLARISATMNPDSKQALWLSAAAWDRTLMSKGLPQWYGTQYHTPVPGGPTELYRVEESAVTDQERAALHVPSLQDAKNLLLEINK